MSIAKIYRRYRRYFGLIMNEELWPSCRKVKKKEREREQRQRGALKT